MPLRDLRIAGGTQGRGLPQAGRPIAAKRGVLDAATVAAGEERHCSRTHMAWLGNLQEGEHGQDCTEPLTWLVTGNGMEHFHRQMYCSDRRRPRARGRGGVQPPSFGGKAEPDGFRVITQRGRRRGKCPCQLRALSTMSAASGGSPPNLPARSAWANIRDQ
jgi:hypothetical protein